jgi:hypothetical protein
MSGDWHSFLKRYKGRGYSRAELSSLYQSQKSGEKKSSTKKKKIESKASVPKEVYNVVVISLRGSIESEPDFEIYSFASRTKAEKFYEDLVGEKPAKMGQAGRVQSYKVGVGEIAWVLIKDGFVH